MRDEQLKAYRYRYAPHRSTDRCNNRESERPMNRVKLALLALGALALCSSAFAAPKDPNVLPVVTPVPGAVTLSRVPTAASPQALETFAAYRIDLANNTTNHLNFVAFTAATFVLNASTTATIDGLIGAPAGCTTTATRLSCALGTLSPGAVISFHVIVKAPTAGTQIDLNWTFNGSEGNSTNGCCTAKGKASTALVDPLADNSTVNTNVTSFVKGSGGTFFTGASAIATSADLWTTTVVIPSGFALGFTTAQVVESLSSSSCASDLRLCVVSALSIPGQFAALDITLRRDVTTFKNGAKIENAILYYQPTESNPAVPIGPCDASGNVPIGEHRCVLSRFTYTKKFVSDNNLPLDFIGDWEFKLKALENGRIIW
jgi:hypothetical protein